MVPHESEVLRNKALIDYRAAVLMSESDEELTSLVCYHIQQYVEKMIKAKLLDCGIEYRKSHDILYLLKLFRNEKISDEFIDDANRLTGYCVNSRYDSLDPSIDEMHRAFDIAEKIIKSLELL